MSKNLNTEINRILQTRTQSNTNANANDPFANVIAQLEKLQNLEEMGEHRQTTLLNEFTESVSKALDKALENPSFLLNENGQLSADASAVLEFCCETSEFGAALEPANKQLQTLLYSSDSKLKKVRRSLLDNALAKKQDNQPLADHLDRLSEGMDARLIGFGILSKEEHQADMLAMMAADPAYNDRVYARIKDVVNKGFRDCSADLLKLGIDNQRMTEEEMRASIYQLYFMSAKLKENQLKAGAVLDFKSKVKGEQLPEVFAHIIRNVQNGIENVENYTADVNSVKNYLLTFNELSSKKRLANTTPAQFQKGIEKYEKEHHLTEASGKKAIDTENSFNVEEMTRADDLLEDIEPEVLNELAHNKGNFKSENSESYKKMGEALAAIRNKQNSMENVAKEDYEALFKACSDYIMSHDSEPFSTSGKKRFQAASRIAGMLAAKLGIGARGDSYANDCMTDMIRSKTFRDAYIMTAQRQIISLMGENSEISQDNAAPIRDFLKNIELCNQLDKELAPKRMVMDKAKNEELQDYAAKLSCQYELLAGKAEEAIDSRLRNAYLTSGLMSELRTMIVEALDQKVTLPNLWENVKNMN